MPRITHIIRTIDASLRLIIINIAVLVTIATVSFITSLTSSQFNMATEVLDLPSGLGVLMRPWSIITYMFTHTDVWHCVFNMIWLYWFGRLYEQFTSGRRTTLLYLAGGIGGALLYITGSILWPAASGRYLEGASGAVMAIVAATACTAPNLKLNLLFLGSIKIKWVALATLVIFGLGLTGSNAGAHLAHIGGLATGAIWALIARARRPRYNKMSTSRLSETDARAELDRLLDKVRRSGYSSLTAMERRRLVELSHNI